jgi:hypothetical protein
MIDNESLPGETSYQLGRRRKLLRINQNVVSKPISFKALNSMHKIVANQKTSVGLGLRHVPEAFQLFELREIFQPIVDVRGRKIDPADHARNLQMVLSQTHKKMRFLLRRVGLNGNGCIDSSSRQFRAQMFREPVPPEHTHFRRDPGVARRIVAPEMLMRVDFHNSAIRKNRSIFCGMLYCQPVSQHLNANFSGA